MPLTSYCKKCGRDVPVGERCPHCGAKLPANAVRLAWCVDHTPLRDWMRWNAVMRVALPVLALALLLALLFEGLAEGFAGIEAALRGGLMWSFLGVLALGAAALTLVFMLQGDDVLDCVVDSKGFHVLEYLPEPTPLRLMLRGKSPRLMEEVSVESPMLLIAQREIAWKEIARVQLWPEKTLLLLYAPVWWLRLAVPCTPFTWEDALSLVSEKLGRRKDVVLPPSLAAPPKAKAPREAKTRTAPAEAAPELSSEPSGAEKAEDFVPLQDVLQELKEQEKQENL